MSASGSSEVICRLAITDKSDGWRSAGIPAFYKLVMIDSGREYKLSFVGQMSLSTLDKTGMGLGGRYCGSPVSSRTEAGMLVAPSGIAT